MLWIERGRRSLYVGARRGWMLIGRVGGTGCDVNVSSDLLVAKNEHSPSDMRQKQVTRAVGDVGYVEGRGSGMGIV